MGPLGSTDVLRNALQVMLQQSGGLCHRHRTRPGRSTLGSGHAFRPGPAGTGAHPPGPGRSGGGTSPSCAAPTEGSTTTCTWSSTSSPGSWSPGRPRAPPLRDRPAQPGTGALRHRRGPGQPAADPGRRRHTTHPERFGHRRPQAPKSPTVAWINQPSQEALIQPAYRGRVSTGLHLPVPLGRRSTMLKGRQPPAQEHRDRGRVPWGGGL